jgi:cytochrome c-type biogenesis protein CcmH
MVLNIFHFNTFAVEPGEFLNDKKQESRARNISKKIRCLICQNQSIDDSEAQIAKDLRSIIRVKILEGKKDDEIYKFLTDRYGDFVLLNPPIKKSTYALWFLPFIFSIMGIITILKHNYKSKKKK